MGFPLFALGPLLQFNQVQVQLRGIGLATSWPETLLRAAAIRTNGSHFLMHSRIWTIAVSNYMKRAAKAIQIQRFPEERAIRTRRTARARVMPSGEIDGQAAV